MAELEVFNSILRTRDGGIYGLNVTQNFYFMRSPKLFVTITNPPAKDSTTGKGRYAKVFLDMTEVIGLIRKLKAGVAHNRSDQGKMELCKIYKGSINRSIAVRVISHNLTAHIGNLHKASVVCFYKSMNNSSLNWFKSVCNFRNRAVTDNVTRILNEILVKEIFYISH